MLPMRWDPFREALGLQERMNRLFSESGWVGEEAAARWAPPVDIFERGDDLVVRAEIPGLQREDIHVGVENGILTLRGERKKAEEYKDENVYRVERSYGAFGRSFSLPAAVDASKIQATYRDGVLEVVLPKAEEAKPRKVEIRAA